ncbi:DUF3291 domain-containing protein [Nonomuraea sp. NPDC050328]|uniref:DUF3291 domain-containing protein n=1 Tax=Nonomuraea sp. NPDC050328 TaxID=3364361 RepID=UPI0037AEB4CB
MHLAQLNVARLRYPIDRPEMADFVNNLETINGLAERDPGFVWRLKGSEEDPTALVEHDLGDFAVTYSIWTSREALWNYIYKSAHLAFLRRRREWFEHAGGGANAVLWWVPEGVIPSLAEGIARLEHLRARGPGPLAFTYKDFHDAADLGDSWELPAAAPA